MKNYINQTARIGKDTIIGYNSVIMENASIGSNCVIGNNVVIHPETKIGNNIRVDDNTVIGKQPMKSFRSATTSNETLKPCDIGDDCIIGTSVVIYRGSSIGKNILIADYASVRENVLIGDYTIVGRGVAIENKSKIGFYCKLETNCYITAFSELEDYTFIAPCVVTTNDNFIGRTKERFKHFKGVTVKKGGRIAAGAVILPGKVIEEDALVGAGSVVTDNVQSKKVVMGAPAKISKDVPKEQLLENQEK